MIQATIAVETEPSLSRETPIENLIVQLFFIVRMFHKRENEKKTSIKNKQTSVFARSRKKSVDDLLTSSADVINQAISIATSPGKDSKLKRSPSPALRKSHKRDRSDASSSLSTDFIEAVSVL